MDRFAFFRPPLRRFRGAWILLATFLFLTATAQDLILSGVRLLPTGEVRIEHLSEATAYFVLERGDAVHHIRTPVQLALGQAGDAVLLDGPPPTARAWFYRLRQVPQAAPLDTDADGIDDVYELRRPGLLNPLDPADAGGDPDEDGRLNLDEYRAGTDPAQEDYALTVRVVDAPAPGSLTEYRELPEAIACLNGAVPAGQLGRVLIATERVLAVAVLDVSAGVTIDVADGFQGKAKLSGPGSAPLVVTAGRGLDFRGLTVENSGGMVFHSPLRFRLRHNTLPGTHVTLGPAGGGAVGLAGSGPRPASGGGTSVSVVEHNTFLGAFDVVVGGSVGTGSALLFTQNRGPSFALDLQGSVGGEVSLSDELYQRTGIKASLLLDSRFTIRGLRDANAFEFQGNAVGNPQLTLENSVALDTSFRVSGLGEFTAFLRYFEADVLNLALGTGKSRVEMSDSTTRGDLQVTASAGGGVSVQETRVDLQRTTVGANMRFDLAANENSRFYANLAMVNGLNVIASIHGETHWTFGDGVKLSGQASFTVHQGVLDVDSHGALLQGGVSVENEHVRATVSGRYQAGSLGPGFELDAPQGIGVVTLEFLGCDFLSGGSIGCWGPEDPGSVVGSLGAGLASPGLAGVGEPQILVRDVKTGLREINVFDLPVPVTIENCIFDGKGDLHVSNVKGPVVVRDVELAEGSVLIQNDDRDQSVTADRIRINGGLAPSLTIDSADAEVTECRVTGPMSLFGVTVAHSATLENNVLTGEYAEFSMDAEEGEMTLEGNQITGQTFLGNAGSSGNYTSRGNQYAGAFSVAGGRAECTGDSFAEMIAISGEGVLSAQGDLSGLQILDFNMNGGLVLDPVSFGANPDEVITFVDFDRDGCGDYPPPQRILGQCVRPGVPPPP